MSTSLGELTRGVLREGIVTPEEVHRLGLSARDLSRSHSVALVEIGDRAYVVKKHEGHEDRSQGSSEQEFAVYRLISAQPTLSRWAPVVRHVGGGEDLLVLRRCDGETASDVAARTGWTDGALAAALGAAIGSWHTQSRPYRSSITALGLPWIYAAFDDDRPSYTRTNEGVRALLECLDDGPLPTWLRAEATRWARGTVIHGDLRLDNCLLDPDLTVRFIDWECAVDGDPAWDVGALVAELLSISAARDAGSCVPVLAGPARLLVASWAERSGETAVDAKLSGRVIGCAAARLLLRALQLAGRGDESAGPERDRHVALATALAGETALSGLVASERPA